MKRAFNIVIKLAVVIAIVIGLMILTLKLLERQPEPLQQGIEQYLSEATGLNARIGTMRTLRLFPDLDVGLDNVTFYKVSDPDFFPMEIERFDVTMPFLSLMVQNAKFRAMNVQNLKAKEGILLKKSLEVTSARIEEKPDQNADIVVEGKYDGAPMRMTVGFENTSNDPQRPLYEAGQMVPFYAQVGEVYLTGTLDRNWQRVIFRQATLKVGNETYGPKDLDFRDQTEILTPISCLLEYGADKELIKTHCLGYFDDTATDER